MLARELANNNPSGAALLGPAAVKKRLRSKPVEQIKILHPKRERNLLLLTLFILLLATSPSYAQVFVDASASGANDGSSWINAYTDLNEALNNTSIGEIWVANGSYKPTTCNPCGNTERLVSFNLPPTIQLYGGFSGNETQLNQRDWTTNLTILSGDIGVSNDSTDNSFRVLSIENSTANTILDGFIIEEGNANGSAIDGTFFSGGGIYLDANPSATANIQIRNCTIRNNFAGGGGGGISMTPSGETSILATVIDSCTFINNESTDRGAGIWYRIIQGTSNVVIKNSTFENNVAGGQGGAVFARASFDAIANDTLANCFFANNRSEGTSPVNDGEGGAVFLRGSQTGTRNHQVLNCAFYQNYASHRGGALGSTSFFDTSSDTGGVMNANLVNCTFFANTADEEGGAVHANGTQGTNSMNITNSILWGDSAATSANELFNNNATITVSFSDVDGGISTGIGDGGNNLDTLPHFSDILGGNLRLSGCSPLLDIGNNDALLPSQILDLDGDLRIHNNIVDLGAYEVGVIYVDKFATGNNDGTSWEDAFVEFQDGITAAFAGDQVWVAEAIYLPVNCTSCDVSDRLTSFQIKPDVEVYGGFSGNETQLNQRDWTTNLTILSGDIGVSNDSTDNSFRVLSIENSTANTILDGFIIEEGNANGSAIDGTFFSGGGIYLDANPSGTANIQIRNCTIRNNFAGGGGGMAIDCVLGGVCEALIKDCIFEGNTASTGNVSSTGGAILMLGNSGAIVRPQIIGCTFQDNFVGNDGGGISMTPSGENSILATVIDSCTFINNKSTDRGAGIWYRIIQGTSNVVIKNSTFENNVAGGQGGAVFARASFDAIANDTLANCFFANNRSEGTSPVNDGEGGAVFLRGSQTGVRNHQVLNCAFYQNYASHRGGALGSTSFFDTPSDTGGVMNANLVNCTFFDNTADEEGGAVHANGTQGTNSMNITNSILWGDSAATSANELFNDNATITVSFSDVDGGISTGISDGGNNLESDPQFLDRQNANLRIASCSPAKDAGFESALPLDLIDVDSDDDNTEQIDIDLDGQDRSFDISIDMGAYEWNDDPPAIELVLNVPSDTSICIGDPLLLSATATGGIGNLTFSWNNGLGVEAEQEVSPDTSTLYQVTVEDDFGCVAEDSVLVSVFVLPEVIITGDTAFCEGSGTTLDAGVFASYSWSNGEVSQTIEVNEAGVYSLTVVDTNGCQGIDDITVIENDTLTPTIQGSLSFCPGSGTTLTVNPSASSYLWSTTDTTQAIEVTEAGDYSVTVADTNGCMSIAAVTTAEIAVPSGEDDFFSLDLSKGLSFELNLVENDFLPNPQDWVIQNLTQPEFGNLDTLIEGITTYNTNFYDEGLSSFQYDICSIQCPDYCDNTNVVLEVVPVLNTNEIILFPNPMSSSATLYLGELEGTIQLGIYDLLGKLLRSELLNVQSGSLVIERGAISSGGYILRLTQEKKSFELKFIVE